MNDRVSHRRVQDLFHQGQIPFLEGGGQKYFHLGQTRTRRPSAKKCQRLLKENLPLGHNTYVRGWDKYLFIAKKRLVLEDETGRYDF